MGGGRKPRLSTVKDKLLYILFYFKCYPTFDLAGLLSDLDRSQANRWMHRLQPLLKAALGQQLAPPKRKLTSMAEFVEAFPEVKQVLPSGLGRTKPRGGQLTAEQKANNRALASERVVYEHSFAGLKRDGIAHRVYRNRKEALITARWLRLLYYGIAI